MGDRISRANTLDQLIVKAEGQFEGASIRNDIIAFVKFF